MRHAALALLAFGVGALARPAARHDTRWDLVLMSIDGLAPSHVTAPQGELPLVSSQQTSAAAAAHTASSDGAATTLASRTHATTVPIVTYDAIPISTINSFNDDAPAQAAQGLVSEGRPQQQQQATPQAVPAPQQPQQQQQSQAFLGYNSTLSNATADFTADLMTTPRKQAYFQGKALLNSSNEKVVKDFAFFLLP